MSPMEAMAVLNKAVQNGMAFLDWETPGWLERVDQAIQDETFDIMDCHDCALALAVRGSYHEGVSEFALSKTDQNTLGFAAWGLSCRDGVTSELEELACGSLEAERARFDPDFTTPQRWGQLTRAWEWNIIARQVGVRA